VYVSDVWAGCGLNKGAKKALIFFVLGLSAVSEGARSLRSELGRTPFANDGLVKILSNDKT
jgi:hypothetical protein